MKAKTLFLWLFPIAYLAGIVDGIYYNFVFLPRHYGNADAERMFWAPDAAWEYVQSPIGALLTSLSVVPWCILLVWLWCMSRKS